MSISLYDLLDVDESASADEIKAAWKSAIADLDPTDRRFRAYNDAAAVLLDAGKRQAYDDGLAAERAEDEAAAETQPGQDVREPVADVGEPAADVAEPRADESEAETETETGPAPATERPVVEPSAPPASPAPAAERAPAAAASGPATLAILVAAGVAVVALVLMVVVLTWPGSVGGEAPSALQDDEASSEQAGKDAEDAASAAVPAVLGYDYRTFDADLAEAGKYLTDDFAEQRSEFFEKETEDGTTLRDQAIADKVVVVASVRGAGLTRVSPEGDRATVVVFIDQASQKGKAAPRTLQMYATFSMVDDDGTWLIDKICTEDSEC